MGRQGGSEENKLRGYKAAVHNERVSEPAKHHAQEEVDRLSRHQNNDERHEQNVKRGLRSAIHNPRVTDEGRGSAAHKLEDMGEPAE
ncbi:uncharacterized protein N7482_009179 [Penicillium canariense]|uniref:Conidiation protein Con-6 n=1 Tax=Penicillium canariense TaxID=189055 RepID=A0A9W9HQT8_9EURO|nr:uncharacterized protein N7482_009179 [Penicillium canariense]KAJ5152701.1 hypothetical protein N7482_009179 [Penicillium canariense]